MKNRKYAGMILAGLGAGTINGLFGTGGGMILVPLMGLLTDLEDHEIFSSSLAVVLPICVVSLITTAAAVSAAFGTALPYLIGSVGGGLAAGFFGKKIPTLWLHRGLGILILWGGLRYLC